MPDLRLALPACALWVAVAALIGVPGAASAVAVAAGAGAAGVLAWCVRAVVLRRHRPAMRASRPVLPFVALVLVAVAVGSVAVAAQAPARESPDLEAALSRSEVVSLLVRVERTPQRVAAGFDGGARWSLRGRTEGGGASVPVSVLFGASEHDARDCAFGAVVRVHGTVRREELGEPTTYTVSARDDVVVAAAPPPWLGWAASARESFARAAASTPGDGGALLPGLAVGDETAVSVDLDEAMKAASLSHLTAVSGANCALVIALVFALARLAGLGRRSRILAAAAALAAFVALVGPGASVIRAAVMAAVLLIGLARGRPADGVPALALAMIVLLVHDPWLGRDYGFVLSVLATAGLLILAGPLSRLLGRWMPQSLAIAVAVPTAAQLACQPVLLLLAPTLPLYGVPANLLAEPAAPVATMLGCIACALLPLAPGLGQAVIWIAWLPSAWIAQVAVFTSRLPGVAAPWAPGLVGVLLSAAVLVAVAVIVLGRNSSRVASIVAVVVLCGGAVVYLATLGGGLVGRALALPPDWQLAACDVGQGDALLIRDGDAVAMIDVGREPEPAAACLDRLGITRIDLLVLSHFDADHVGGLSAVAGRVEHAIVQRPVRDADERTLAILRAAGVPTEHGYAGLSGRLGGVSWRVLWPPAQPTGGQEDTGNAGSITLETDGRGLRTVFLGDLGEEAQDALIAAGAVHPVDVVKVAHHGSADQSPDLYRRLHARLGLVSVGVRNGYGHPTASALRMLADSGTAVARTDEQGMLLVSPISPTRTGPAVRVWSERMPDSIDSGRPYPGYGRGGMWPPEAAAEPARARRGPPRARSRSFPGIRCVPRRSSSSPGPRHSSPTGPSARSVTHSRPKIPASRSATSTRATTPPASCSHSRAPPCSVSRA
jgi:competence protein ComEC